MRKGLIAAFSVAFLSGCASTPPQPVSTFNPAEAQYSRAKGTATIKGQAFLRRNDGVVVYGAGSDVALIPKVSHTDDAFATGFGGAKLRNEHSIFAKPFNLDPGVEAFVRRTKADGQGNFSFEAVPPGSYYVMGKVTWCAPSQYGCLPQGGDLVETITVAPSDKVLTAMLTGA